MFQNGAIALGAGHPKREIVRKCLTLYRNEPSWQKSIKFSFPSFPQGIDLFFLNLELDSSKNWKGKVRKCPTGAAQKEWNRTGHFDSSNSAFVPSGSGP